MRRALRLAKQNLGRTSPNPSVGALVVKDGEIIAHGVTSPPGGAHAEIVALSECDANGAVLYSSLEPCSHHGRTGPCTETIISSGISCVVIAANDKNPEVDGKGVDALRSAGIEVITGILEDEAIALYTPYFHYITTKMPFVTLKIAQTIDGKMTWGDGKRKWITGVEADEFSHMLRKENDAILVGVGTVLKDDPRLTCRLSDGPDPVKIVLDSSLQTPPDAKVLAGRAIVFCTEKHDVEKYDVLKKKCDVVILESLDVRSVLDMLGELGITSVLVEGGPTIAGAFLKGFVHRMHVLIGDFAVGEGRGIEVPFSLSGMSVTQLGRDACMTGTIKYE